MYHVCNLIISACELVTNWVSERLHLFSNFMVFCLFFILRDNLEIKVSLYLGTNFVKIFLFILLWADELIELLSQILVDNLIKFIEFII